MVKQYNIRKLTSNNETGDAHGITIPKNIATDDVRKTKFTVTTGNEFSHNIQIDLIDSTNAIFKQMSIEFPAEQYPKLTYFKLQLRAKIDSAVEPLHNSIILVSGGTYNEQKREDFMVKR